MKHHLNDCRSEFENKGYWDYWEFRDFGLKLYGNGGGEFNFRDISETTNVRLKWISICFNIDYKNGTADISLNGEILKATNPMKMVRPDDHEANDVIVHLGRRFGKESPLIGKIVNFNMWDR